MVSTLIQVIDSLVNLYQKKAWDNIDSKEVLKNVILSTGQTSSLTDIAKLARVEPLAVVSRDCMTLDYLPNIMNTMLNIFIGYYLQAIAIGARIDSIKVIKTLDRLNPDRDHTGWLMASSLESLNDLSVLDASQYEFKLPRHISLEAKGGKGSSGKKPKSPEPYMIETNTVKSTHTTNEVDAIPDTGHVRDIGKVLSETANLAVGKIVNVEINVTGRQVQQSATQKTTVTKIPVLDANGKPVLDADGNPKFTIDFKDQKLTDRTTGNESSSTSIPVLIRLSPSLLPTVSIVKMLTVHGNDDTLVERFHAWRSGRINFIRDLVLCQDMIDEHKKALMNDEQGTYSEIMRRVNNSRKYGMLTQNPSLATASNLFVLSYDTALQIEQRLGGKLSNPRVREKMFDATYAMIIAVIDTRYNRAVFYHRGISAATDVSIRELSNSKESKGPDIMDIFKAYQLGNAPSY